MTAKNGYEGIYDWVCAQLATVNLAERAPRLGLVFTEDGKVRVNFFGREYLVDNSGACAADNQPAPINHRSLVAHYAMSEGRGEPGGDFVTLHRLSSNIDQGGIFECASVSKTLDRKFGPNTEALRQRAAELGGAELPDEAAGGLTWLFHAFPKVPIKLVHYPADDEFEAEYKILFDKSATAFMVFEALGFLSGAFVGELLA